MDWRFMNAQKQEMKTDFGLFTNSYASQIEKAHELF
jgi:hypothetical protein